MQLRTRLPGTQLRAQERTLPELSTASVRITPSCAGIFGLARTQSAAPPVFEGAVRVIEIPGVDVQPCGGTHVRCTVEIGRVVCDRIEKKSKHNRRVVLRFAEG